MGKMSINIKIILKKDKGFPMRKTLVEKSGLF
jgi:hypothetical protein